MKRITTTVVAGVMTAALVAVAWSSAQALGTTIDAPEPEFVANVERIQPAVPYVVEMRRFGQDGEVIDQTPPVEQVPAEVPTEPETRTDYAPPPQYEGNVTVTEETPPVQAPTVETSTGDSPPQTVTPTDPETPPPYVEPTPDQIVDVLP